MGVARATITGQYSHLGTSADPVDLREGAVEGVQKVQRTARCPHPALVPFLGQTHKARVGTLDFERVVLNVESGIEKPF